MSRSLSASRIQGALLRESLSKDGRIGGIQYRVKGNSR